LTRRLDAHATRVHHLFAMGLIRPRFFWPQWRSCKRSWGRAGCRAMHMPIRSRCSSWCLDLAVRMAAYPPQSIVSFQKGSRPRQPLQSQCGLLHRRGSCHQNSRESSMQTWPNRRY